MTAATFEHPSVPKFGLWAGRAMSAVVVLFIGLDGALKLIDLEIVRQGMTRLGYPPALDRPIGVLELAVMALYLCPRTSTLGALLLTGLMGGAISTYVRVGDLLDSHVLVGLYLGVLAWAGLYLRDRRLQGAFAWRESGAQRS